VVAAAAVAVAAVLALLPSCGASRQSCGAARHARSAEAGTACDAALHDVHRGQTKARVTALLGAPDRAPRCWLYRWMPEPTSAVDGARICFSGDRVALVQTAVHG
jgi:hypothetical protein